MKTKVAAIYGKRDVRLRVFELPEITDNELLVSVISDSVCLSTWKAALLGSEHKRVPDDLENHPVITGHECAGVIVEVGKNLTGKYKKGQRFVLQPAMGLPSGYSAGYSYEYFGGNATYMIIPEIAINLGCVLPYHGSYFAAASLAEPDIADLEAGVCQQLLGLFDADGIEQVVIALLFYCISRIRVRGSINFPNRQCCQFKAVNLMQNSL